jgi:hypothetical protein
LFQQHIHNWIETFLSVPSETFNNLPPCPFAKQAMIENKIQYAEIKPMEHISMHDYFIAELENFSYHWPKGKEVVIIGCNPEYISSEELTLAVETSTTRFLSQRGYIALEDHPDEEEKVKDVILNNKNYAVVFLQNREKLNAARKALHKQDYYKNWTQDYYEDVVDDL